MIPVNCDRPSGSTTTSAVAATAATTTRHESAPRSTAVTGSWPSPSRRRRRGDGAHMVRSSAMPNRPCGRHKITRIISTQRDRLPVGARQVVAGPVLQQPDEEATEQRAPDLIETADDGRGEGEQAEADAAVPTGVGRRRHQQRGDRHQHGVDRERVEDHPTDGDPEHPGRVRALRGSLHLPARVGPAEEQLESQDHDDAHHQDPDVVGRDGDPARPPHLRAEHRRELLRGGTELDSQVLPDDEAEADGGDDERDVVATRRQQAIDERHLEHVVRAAGSRSEW